MILGRNLKVICKQRLANYSKKSNLITYNYQLYKYIYILLAIIINTNSE